MILSFHPLIKGDRQITCAGRDPDENDLTAIRSARAVILPQGCRESLYRMAKQNCAHIFPNYDARFTYPGKLKQIELFKKKNAPHPKTKPFSDIASFNSQIPSLKPGLLFDLPFVFKFDWGGEGDFVFLVQSFEELASLLTLAATYEKSGQKGFLIQEFIQCNNRSLRVVVIYRKTISYWRKHQDGAFYATLSKGAVLDRASDPVLIEAAEKMVGEFCRKTHINLAGFDLIFSQQTPSSQPLFLEINYFFGRTGLGGSEKYYALLTEAVNRWIEELPD